MASDSRRERIMRYIESHVKRHGFPPSVREIGEAVGLRSPSSVFRHLRILEADGRLSHFPQKRRAWSIETGSAQTPPPDSVPLLGRIAAGHPILAQEHIEEFVVVPREVFRGTPDFLLKVVGDSMVGAGILEGDLVVVQAQSRAEDGDIVIALIEEEATVKRLRIGSTGPYLQPENPRYAPIIAPNLQILGKVIGVVRAY